MKQIGFQNKAQNTISLIEYIISCYGARKGVVDTAIRTSDVGYLTRRLVELVQHIVVPFEEFQYIPRMKRCRKVVGHKH